MEAVMYTLAWRARSGLIGLALFAGTTATARADDAQAFGFEAAAQEITQLLWLADTARVCGWASEDEAMRFKQFSIRFINSHLTGVYKAAINSMLADQEALARMHHNTLEAVKRELNWEKESQQLVGLYDNILVKHKGK